MSFSCEKGEFDRCFNQLDRPVKESRPDRFPSVARGPGMVVNIVVNYRCKRKMLKETETEKQ